MHYLGLLLRRHLTQYPGRLLAAWVVLTFASTLMLALAGVGMALKFKVGARLVELFPEERFRLEAARSAIGPIALEPRPINDETIGRLRQRPDVAEVIPIESARFPLRVQGTLFNQEISSDAVLHGVPRELVADAIAKDLPWGPPADPTEPYPLVGSHYFFDLYNLGLARSSGLPLLDAGAVIGRHLTIVAGESNVELFQSAAPPRRLRARIVGLSADPSLLGLALPAEVVRNLNLEFSPTPERQFVQLVVKLRPEGDADRFLGEAAALGLTLAGGEALGRQLKSAVRIMSGCILGLAAATFALGWLTFYLLSAMTFHARRVDLIRLRALGATPRQLTILALGEIGVLTLAATLAAGLLDLALMRWAAARSGDWLAARDWLPPDLLSPSLGGLACLLSIVLIGGLLPALPMLRWTLVVEPADVIRDL